MIHLIQIIYSVGSPDRTGILVSEFNHRLRAATSKTREKEKPKIFEKIIQEHAYY